MSAKRKDLKSQCKQEKPWNRSSKTKELLCMQGSKRSSRTSSTKLCKIANASWKTSDRSKNQLIANCWRNIWTNTKIFSLKRLKELKNESMKSLKQKKTNSPAWIGNLCLEKIWTMSSARSEYNKEWVNKRRIWLTWPRSRKVTVNTSKKCSNPNQVSS